MGAESVGEDAAGAVVVEGSGNSAVATARGVTIGRGVLSLGVIVAAGTGVDIGVAVTTMVVG